MKNDLRKTFTIFVVFIVILSFAACSGTTSGKTDTNEGNDPEAISSNVPETVDNSNASENEDSSNDTTDSNNILIAYFTAAENSGVDAVSSASVLTIDGTAKGMSQAIADIIAEHTGGDLFAIQTSVVYPAEFSDLTDYAAEEQANNVLPELTTHIENLDDYDTLFIGFPIWWYDMPQVMYAFFEEYDFSGKTIILFAVSNGSNISGIPDTIQKLEPGATVIQSGLTINRPGLSKIAESVPLWLTELGY